jgi:hypothetical protein
MLMAGTRANRTKWATWPEDEEGFSLPQDEAEMDPIRDVLQKIAAQVCMNVIQQIHDITLRLLNEENVTHI